MTSYQLACPIARRLKHQPGIGKLDQARAEDWDTYGGFTITLKGGRRVAVHLKELTPLEP